MNAIRLLRSQAGITQKALADYARTSQSTIAFYESGAKSPTLSTLQRLASSLGLEVIVAYAPRFSREDQRSLSYHRAVVKKLESNPSFYIKKAKQNLRRMRRHHAGAKSLFDAWQVWLDLPIDELVSKMLDPAMTARDMRQVSPFAGALNPKERLQILTQFRKELQS